MRRQAVVLTAILAVALSVSLQAAPQAAAGAPEAAEGPDLAPGSVLAKSAVKSVTVFPERATVVREAELRLAPADKAVVFEGLPATLIPSSLRVTGKGTAAVKILGLDVTRMFLESALLPEIKKLQAEIDALEREAAEIKARLDVLDTQEKFLKSIESSSAAKASQDIAAGRIDTAGWERVVDFLGTKLQAVKAGGLEEQAALKDRQAKSEALKKRLAEMKPQRPQEARRVTVYVETAQAGSFAMALSYAVTEARWHPVYTLRALPDAGEVELQTTALIRQRSGENWTGVKALLSTASPALKADPSDLRPWYLDIAVPRRMRVAE
ncbi:MAG: mucoidy inhibitor MuiA family protein, partial [Candidatus Aminicenantes bacterium]|nr:mucoidy inhibitor MuiA family protein [Candidatus Aminicenantes bacterium]